MAPGSKSRGYKKEFLSEPIDPVDLSPKVANLQCVEDQTARKKEDGVLHYCRYAYLVTMRCKKVRRADLSNTEVNVQLEWGITDRINHKRKCNARYLYVLAKSGGCDLYTENWQPEVNQLMKQIRTIIRPLIVDEPHKDDLGRLRNVTNQWVEKGAV